MNRILAALVSALTLSLAAHFALAAGGYNDVPPGDPQYLACKAYAMNRWEGGSDKSPVAGQTKAEAFCECLWNETPDDFKGSLAKFSESDKGASVNKICEKHSNWHD
ncbi:hypothetical protein F6R98_08460 [Candidatus Methylospira mobilis]|uniref:Uncharacterized protein n=1 Tax=Candidatus Methylospira mobilis TaxID=1808979 RepID=A0A5Q0BFQ0_9GAMM|nr:hypothetical protein [Candidatus Methylospira mobilis]QFY42650.1 hypothetical protein F6R98_08460 [Candidatus Methylospira mobilis]